MSTLTNHLRMATTGQRKPLPMPFLTTKVQKDFDPIKHLEQYTIEATFREVVWSRVEETDYIFKRITYDMNSALYGEVTAALNRIDRALAEYDILAARNALQEAFETVKP